MAFDKNIKRQKQNKISIEDRINSFNLVDKGLNEKEALLESSRCMSCPKPSCVAGCPLKLDIPSFIKEINTKNFDKANEIVTNASYLSGICALVCNAGAQCEGHCIRGKAGEPVYISGLHRFAATFKIPKIIKSNSIKHKIGIIGAGPSGLSAAIELYKLGYNVTIFEKENDIGGVPFYGIPEFRLPKDYFENLMNNIKNTDINLALSKEIKLDEIINDFDAVFIAVGSNKNKKMNIPGENLNNIILSDEFLKNIKVLHKKTLYSPYKNVIVVGGGNVAMDVSRTLVRLGKNVKIIYRRSLQEAPARKEEILEAKEEGIEFCFLTNPVSFIGKDKVEFTRVIKMELGPIDESGRRSPVEIKGSEYDIPTDLVIYAIGSSSEDKYYSNSISTKRNGIIDINEHFQTNNPKVFAGGDVVNGPDTVVKAVFQGKQAAFEIDKYLNR